MNKKEKEYGSKMAIWRTLKCEWLRIGYRIAEAYLPLLGARKVRGQRCAKARIRQW